MRWFAWRTSVSSSPQVGLNVGSYKARNGPKIGPSWPKLAEVGQVGSRLSPSGPLSAPSGPCWPQVGSKLASKRSKLAQDGPRWPQVGPRWPQDGPKLAVLGGCSAQHGPNMGPTWAQLRPNMTPKSKSGGFPKHSWNEAGLEDGFSVVFGLVFAWNSRSCSPQHDALPSLVQFVVSVS